jgi:PAS domain S-box-containing protein
MNTYAAAELDVGAYLGAPLRAQPDLPDSPIIGTVCAVDHVSRLWSAEDIEILTDIAGGVAEVIATRAQQRSAMRIASQQLARILQHVAVGVICTDASGVTTYANATAERLLGVAASQLIGHDQHALIHHSRADGSRFPETECPHYVARRAGRVCHEEHDTFWRADGSPFNAVSTMTPIKERGEVIGSVLTFTDVTVRRAAETANTAKDELLRLVAKELEGPLDTEALKTLAGLLAT